MQTFVSFSLSFAYDYVAAVSRLSKFFQDFSFYSLFLRHKSFVRLLLKPRFIRIFFQLLWFKALILSVWSFAYHFFIFYLQDRQYFVAWS